MDKKQIDRKIGEILLKLADKLELDGELDKARLAGELAYEISPELMHDVPDGTVEELQEYYDTGIELLKEIQDDAFLKKAVTAKLNALKKEIQRKKEAGDIADIIVDFTGPN